jgi:Histidine kinase-, DNA gyrase B-, and HSP90-like ATPase
LGNRIIQPKEPPIDLVRILSEGTYTSFAQALKEFVSNSYDACATDVALRFDDDFSSLAIRDYGHGMTSNDFETVFASIGRSGGGSSSHCPGVHREHIGRFGIGSLAILGIADRFTIRSVKKGSSQGFEASIDLTKLRKSYQKGKDLTDIWQFALSEWTGEKAATHFTEITVDGIRDDIKQMLQRTGKAVSDPFRTIEELSGLEELRWRLGLICPVEYANTYPISSRIDETKDQILIEQVANLKKAKFKMTLNQLPVVNPTFLPSYDPERPPGTDAKLINRRGLGYDIAYLKSDPTSKVKFKGYLCVQAHQVFPTELRGILIRLRGVAVGWHRTLNLGASVATMLTSMSGEVWVDGLDEALQFDRESFREDHPSFVWLKEQIQKTVDVETKKFRDRSERRVKLKRKDSKTGKGSDSKKKKIASTKKATSDYISPEILDRMPPYILRLLPQINGAYENEWYEAAAMVLRRLVETLIIELYSRRGWTNDVQDPTTKEFLPLKALIGKINGDARLNTPKRTIDGLNNVKELGDTAAHDFKIRIRKTDLDRIQTSVRMTLEKLIFTIGETSPTSP